MNASFGKIFGTCLGAAVGGAVIASIATTAICHCKRKFDKDFPKKKATRKSSSKKAEAK